VRIPSVYEFSPNLDTTSAIFLDQNQLKFTWDSGGLADWIGVSINLINDGGYVVQSYTCIVPETDESLKIPGSVWSELDQGLYWEIRLLALRTTEVEMTNWPGHYVRGLGVRSWFGAADIP
jgi:hypothetical protein